LPRRSAERKRTAIGLFARLNRSWPAAVAALTAYGAQAKDDKPLTAQQERMKSCNAEAGGKSLKGDERRQFMSKCLRASDPQGRVGRDPTPPGSAT
jgi:hypothetical protein